MKTRFKNGTLVNVFTGELEKTDVWMEGDRICALGPCPGEQADQEVDASGKYICPGFIDSHSHIESSMLLPAEFARAAAPHGTTAVVTDPHELANVCGEDGVRFMLEASENLPVTVYMMVPSCVPATPFDEAGASLGAAEVEAMLDLPRVLGLGEMMDYPAVIRRDPAAMEKIRRTQARGLVVNGHAPLLDGAALDRYIAAGITDDHECAVAAEGMARIRRGQRVMIRQGTAARNLAGLMPLFQEPWASRCLLVSDDKHPADLLEAGHMDDIIRQAVRLGGNVVTGIRMASLWAAEYYGLRDMGAVAPGCRADLLLLSDLESVQVQAVYKNGKLVAENGVCLPFDPPRISPALREKVCHSFHLQPLAAEDFYIQAAGRRRCHVIGALPDQLLTEDRILELDFDRHNGIDLGRDILKIAVVERHKNTGHTGLGFISGLGLQAGAIAASVAHDAHNLIIVGTNEADMAAAANCIRTMGGGSVVVQDGKVLARMPLPYGGLMTDLDAAAAAKENAAVRESVYALGASRRLEPFMTMAFISLPVIPHLKLTTLGLVDVDRQQLLPLFAGQE